MYFHPYMLKNVEKYVKMSLNKIVISKGDNMKKGIEPIRVVVLAAIVLVVLFVVFMYVYSDNIDGRNRTYSAIENDIRSRAMSEASEENGGRIDINTASLEMLRSVPGMSENNAREIILYRERHGGFADIEELKQLPSFDEDTYLRVADKLFASDSVDFYVPQHLRVNINTADIRELKTVPGMDSDVAENIIAYRKKYGDFQSVQELKDVYGIGEDTYNKIAGYLTVR